MTQIAESDVPSVSFLDPVAAATVMPAEELEHVFLKTFAEGIVPATFRPLGGPPQPSGIAKVAAGPVDVTMFAMSPVVCLADPKLMDVREGLVFDIVTEGAYEFRQRGRAFTVAPGGMMVAHRSSPFEAHAPQFTRHRTLFVPDAAVQGRMRDPSGVRTDFHRHDIPEVRLLHGYVQAVEDLARGGSDIPVLAGRQVVDLVLAMMARVFGEEDPSEGGALRAARIAEIKRLVEKAAGDPLLNTARVARSLGVTPRYVQILMEETGTTFSEYLMERRLTLAYERLTARGPSAMSIREVAESCGFSDPAHFSRAFRRRFGDTPTSVRAAA